MNERIRFYFDPVCPWCYQTSRWLKHVATLGEVDLSWGLFSLQLQNAGQEPEELAEAHALSALALRTAVAVRDAAGNDAVGAFYGALGARVHERGEPLQDAATVKASLDSAGLDPALADKAADDDKYAQRVEAEHRGLTERTQSFGVPTIVLDGGEGPAIFGPVISEPPADEAEALELFQHVVWLARNKNFAELKRARAHWPDLESARRSQHVPGRD
jgi:predicted DsbA family dithiol-disulfide isomerase